MVSSAQTPAPTTTTRTADAIVQQMTLDEKLDLLGGVDGFFIRDIPRLTFLVSKWPMAQLAFATSDLLLQWLAASH